ncbi:MAG: hypothetical protein ACSHWW_10545 [Nonlabens sp.]|uniref:hypothetical protein n=1 Tax=Nonlabens sp. TaxID=1888209 RepID=UPI003EF2731D
MRYFIWSALLSVFILNAQDRIEVDLTFEYNDELTYYEDIGIGPLGLEVPTTLESLEEGYLPFNGFQYVQWYDYKAPIHLEEGDSFITVLGKNFNEYEYYYTGEKGAIKNNYLLSRHRELNSLEADSTFIQASQEKAQVLILQKKDSLLNVVKALSLSERFLEDENKFWDYYTAYHQVFHKQLRSADLDYSTVSLSDFPELDYDIEEDHFNYKRYLDLGVAYYFNKISQLNTYEEMRDAFKKIDSKSMRWCLRDVFQDLVLKRDERSEVYMKLVERFSYSPHHYQEAKNVFNKRKRLSVGDEFPIPKVTDFFEKEIDLEKAIGRGAYLFIYTAKDKNLDENFLKWNQFYVNNKGNGSRFITIGLDIDQSISVFKDFFLTSQIAGSHLRTTSKQSRKFIYNLGLAYGPFIVEVDEDWNIHDFNVKHSFKTSNMLSPFPSAIPWKPQLGAY